MVTKKKKSKKKEKTMTKSGNLRIVLKKGVWTVYDKDNNKIDPCQETLPPLDPPEMVIIVQHVSASPEGLALPKHRSKEGTLHAPYNTHCHKTVYIGGVPYLVHC